MPPDVIEAEDDRLPGSMADLFFALVAVVIFMILALVPALEARAPDAAAATAALLDRSPIRIGGAPATVLLAGRTGLRVAGPPGRDVALSAIPSDEDLAAVLRRSASGGNAVLLAIEPDGQESAFLFDALAGSLGLGEVYEMRLDKACGHVADAALLRACRAGAALPGLPGLPERPGPAP